MSPKSKVAGKMPLRILHLEDNPDDRKLVERELMRDGLSCRFLFVGSREEFELAISQNEFDLIISDFALPSYGGEMIQAGNTIYSSFGNNWRRTRRGTS
jgi:CheY-like chemotaxis protein